MFLLLQEKEQLEKLKELERKKDKINHTYSLNLLSPLHPTNLSKRTFF